MAVAPYAARTRSGGAIRWIDGSAPILKASADGVVAKDGILNQSASWNRSPGYAPLSRFRHPEPTALLADFQAGPGAHACY